MERDSRVEVNKYDFQLNLRSEQRVTTYNSGIMATLHSLASRARRFYRKVVVRASCRIIQVLIHTQSHRIQISYDAKNVSDGLGAQIQRQLSIHALSNFLGVSYIPAPIEQIAIHPLDSFQTVDEMQAFLVKVNRAFDLEAPNPSECPITHRMAKLTIFKLFTLIVLSRLATKPIHISTCEVYGIVDFLSDFYSRYLPPRQIGFDHQYSKDEKESICIHFRQGVGGQVIYPGQKLSRELDLEYFINTLSKTDHDGKRIFVLTDAPALSMTYKPVTDQAHLWDGTPKFNDGEMSITGLDLKNVFRSKGFDVEVVSGGDPLVALFLMINCSTLIMSRSSLSYVAGILNSSATIYYPPGFWHPPMGDWKILT